jgi:hypothetical protein
MAFFWNSLAPANNRALDKALFNDCFSAHFVSRETRSSAGRQAN